MDFDSPVASILGLWSNDGCGPYGGCGFIAGDAHLKEQFMLALPRQPGRSNVTVDGREFLTRNNLVGQNIIVY